MLIIGSLVNFLPRVTVERAGLLTVRPASLLAAAPHKSENFVTDTQNKHYLDKLTTYFKWTW